MRLEKVLPLNSKRVLPVCTGGQRPVPPEDCGEARHQDARDIEFARKAGGNLKGRKIGTPGKYGSSWIMLQALLGSAGLTPDDTTIVEYPDFGQGVALRP